MATVAELVARISADTTALQRELNRASGQLKDFENTGAKATKSVNSGFLSLKNTLAGLGLAYIARDMINTAMAAEALQSRMLGASGNAEVAAHSLAFIRQESERLGLSFIESANSFAGFSAATLRSGLTLEQTKNTFLGVAEAARVFKLSQADTQLVFQALQQMASKGVVSMEEFRQQLGERLPIATSVAAKAMGVTEAELIKMIASGELAARDFLPRFGEAMRKEVAGSVEMAAKSVASNVARMQNALYDLKTTVAGGQFMAQFNDTLINLTKILQNQDIQKGLGEIVSIIGQLANVAVRAIAGLGGMFDAIDKKIKAAGEGIMAGLFGEEGLTALAKARGQNSDGLAKEIVATTVEGTAKAQKMMSEAGLNAFTLNPTAGASGGEEKDAFSGLAGGKNLDAELETLNDYWLTAEEQELAHHERRIMALQDYLETEKNLTADQRSQLENIQSEHQRVMTDMQEQQAKKQFENDKKKFTNLIAQASGANKTFFELNKIRAISEAVLSAKEAIQGAYAVGAKIGGPVLGAAFAATAAAATAANIASIASTSYGSSSSGGGSGGGGGGATPVQTVDEFGRNTNLSTNTRSTNVQITLQGSTFTDNQVRELIERINDQTGDNVSVRINR